MPFRDHFNQIKTKLEDINRQHNILPFGQGNPQQQQQQQYPGSTQPYPAPYPYQQQGPSSYPSPQGVGYHQQQPGLSWQNSPQPATTYNRPPAAPPVPASSHPHHPSASSIAPGPTSIYWQARFEPSTRITQDWDQKQGNNNGWGNSELQNYTSNPENNFYTGDGKMILRAVANQSAANAEHKYTSARLVSRQTLARNKGVLTAWLTLPCASGIWPAFWLLPREPFTWPHEGEIDIAESWNGDCKNHSCLHWGFYNGEDWAKHLVRETHLPEMPSSAIRFDLTWDCPSGGEGGRLMWSINGRPVMKNLMPPGTRPIHDWCIVLNVAMGGNVCQGQVPRDGAYDMIVHHLSMSEQPEGPGGWSRFEQDWQSCPEGTHM